MNIRKLTYTLILAATLIVVAFCNLHAQNLEKKISIQVSEVSLETALNEISDKGNIFFAYNPRKLPVKAIVSLKADNKTIHSILHELLVPLGVIYFVKENQVVLRQDNNSEIKNHNQKKELPKFTISGYIRDKSSGEVLIGASIYDKKSFQGTTSNAFGFYSITLPSGNYDLTCSLIGYAAEVRPYLLNKNETLNFSLAESSIEMKAVEIISVSGENTSEPSPGGEVNFSSSSLKQMAGFAGNTDVLKSLQCIPGINPFGDGSSFYYVRGGNSDQNLLLIDDAPIFNPAHLFGFFSALSPDAIKDVKSYKGDFPASYGGRLSSITDVRARDGNLNRLGFSGNLGIYTSDFTVEGPLVKEKSSFILSARRSNLNWLNNEIIESRSFSVNFYDLNAKLNIRINDKNRLFLTGFSGNDVFSRFTEASFNTFGLSWDNTTATIRWNHLFNNRLFVNTTALFSEYNYYLYISREQDDYWNSSISNKTLKTDFSWYPNPSNTVKFGIELSNYYSNPGNVHFSDDETQRNAPQVSKYNSLGLSLYLSNNHKINEKLALNYGMRFSSWRNIGPATVFLIDANHNAIDTVDVDGGNYFSPYYNFEPRISLIWTLSPISSISAGYSRTAQYLQMLSNSTSPFTSLEVWAPSGPNIKPQKADQLSIGYTIRPGNKLFTLSFEAFYKKYQNQIDYKDHANMLYNPLIEGELRFGSARSYGTEILLRKNKGNMTGWVGYSYSRSLRKITDVNNGVEFPASYDHPHSLFANIEVKAGKRWSIAANWLYMTGSAFSSPTGFMQYNGYTVPMYGSKNNDRYPDYHRLDVSVSFRLNRPEQRYRHNLVLSVYNAYGRNNPFSISFNKIMNDNGDYVVPSDLEGNYEIIPTRISVAGIIPSINYTFKF